jgi:hypothetical protein
VSATDRRLLPRERVVPADQRHRVREPGRHLSR